MDNTGKVVILPCSGIGKPTGALAREIAYELAERARPEKTAMTCLPLLVIGDADALKLVRENPVITIDGCALECARKSLEAAGAKPALTCQSVKFFLAHKELKPEGVAQLNEAGRKLAGLAADELAAMVDRLANGEDA